MAKKFDEDLRQLERKFAIVAKSWNQAGDERSARRANKLARRLSAMERSA